MEMPKKINKIGTMVVLWSTHFLRQICAIGKASIQELHNYRLSYPIWIGIVFFWQEEMLLWIFLYMHTYSFLLHTFFDNELASVAFSLLKLAKNDRTPFGKIKRKCRGESMMSSLWGF
jgi:hypothetical protein